MNEKQPLSVDELSLRLKGIIEESGLFSRLAITGEVSGKKEHSTAVYFDLKGEKSLISCLVWRDVYLRSETKIEDGDKIVAYGELGYYQARGKLTFKAYRLEKAGEGKALAALRELYRKLKLEGLFDREKKKIPSYPEKIAVVTGYRSAAESDILRNLPRRWPLATIVLYSAYVQGERAPASIVGSLRAADASDAEVVILARGGGSNEDLSPFNDEMVVRAVASLHKPCVSAVGHEIDVSLVDFASDLRASTPTAACELASPDIDEVSLNLEETGRRLRRSFSERLALLRSELERLRQNPFFLSPLSSYEGKKERLNYLSRSLSAAFEKKASSLRWRLSSAEAALASLSPERTLERGYAYLEKDGRPLVSARGIAAGESVKAHLKDGIIRTKVEEVIANGE